MSEEARDSWILVLLRRIKPQVWTAFFSVLVFGLVSQGTGLFNKLSHHDDIAVREVQHLRDAVHHGIAQRNYGIYAAKTDSVDQIGQKTHI